MASFRVETKVFKKDRRNSEIIKAVEQIAGLGVLMKIRDTGMLATNNEVAASRVLPANCRETASRGPQYREYVENAARTTFPDG